MKSDARAAVSIASRRGLGKVRHIQVCQLWLQETVRRGDVKIGKVTADENLADALTKHVSSEGIRKHMHNTHQIALEGRHPLAPVTEC